jgi:DNA-binding protein HU-beta
MNKTELAQKVAERAGVSQSKASDCLNSVLDVIGDALSDGDKVSLPGFGTFSVGERAERQGKNPQTGEAMTIPAAKTCKFKAGLSLKNQVNGK